MKKEVLKHNFKTLGIFLLAVWGVFLLSKILPFINNFGIRPREISGLVGVFASPFLHKDLNHITSNTGALVIFSAIFSLVEGKESIRKMSFLLICSGFFTWLIGRPNIHIGASGLIFAFYGYLISLGFFKKKFVYVVLSVALLAIYGHLIFGVFPTTGFVSWEGHLSGFIAGVILAKYDK